MPEGIKIFNTERAGLGFVSRRLPPPRASHQLAVSLAHCSLYNAPLFKSRTPYPTNAFSEDR